MKKKTINKTDLTNESVRSVANQMDVRLPFNRYVLFFGLLIVGLGLDLWTKNYFFTHYFDPEIAKLNYAQPVGFWWIDEILGVQTSTNPGALFGMGKGLSWLFAIFSIFALICVLAWLFIFKAAIDRWLTFALGMISGGILGNLYDRLGFGALASYPEAIRDNVRDWIYFRIEGGPRMFDPWPNFNIADMLLVTGAAMLFIHALLMQPPNQTADIESETEFKSSESNPE